MPYKNSEEEIAVEVKREGCREEGNGNTQDHFFRTNASKSLTFQDIRVTEMLTFGG